MNKEDILVMMYEKGYEVDNSEGGTFNSERLCILANGDNLWFIPKQKFPIVFENEYYTIEVGEDGHITVIDKDTKLRANYGVELSLPLLEQAIAKSKEIRGLK